MKPAGVSLILFILEPWGDVSVILTCEGRCVARNEHSQRGGPRGGHHLRQPGTQGSPKQ